MEAACDGSAGGDEAPTVLLPGAWAVFADGEPTTSTEPDACGGATAILGTTAGELSADAAWSSVAETGLVASELPGVGSATLWLGIFDTAETFSAGACSVMCDGVSGDALSAGIAMWLGDAASCAVLSCEGTGLDAGETSALGGIGVGVPLALADWPGVSWPVCAPALSGALGDVPGPGDAPRLVDDVASDSVLMGPVNDGSTGPAAEPDPMLAGASEPELEEPPIAGVVAGLASTVAAGAAMLCEDP